MVETFEESPERLPRPPGHRILLGALGDLVLRPWFDWVALKSVARGYLPLSRAWAAALAAGESHSRFLAEVPADDLPRALTLPMLRLVDSRRAAYEEAAATWEARFFGPSSPGPVSAGLSSPDPEALVAAEMAREDAAHQLMLTRFAFLPLRGRLPPVRWRVATPEATEARHGARLVRSDAAFPAPDPPDIRASRPVLGAYGREFWLKYRAPVMGDLAWARVVEPERVKDPPTLIFLHGITMETEMWRGMADMVSDLALEGVRIVKPEGPWHSRRRPPGWYGGEPAMGLGPLGFLDLFQAWIAGVAALIDWARRTSRGPVAIGGVSLGALIAQRAAVAARHWPPELRPDGLFLVATSGAMMEVAHGGGLAEAVKLAPQIEAVGWTVEGLSRWLPLLEPQEPPALDPARIVMLIGHSDDVMPSAGGLALARRWRVPEGNLFARRQGHFSVSLGLLRDRAPFARLKEILDRAA